MAQNPFDRSGIASPGDMDSPEWRDLFALLEREQADFLSREDRFRSPGYAWTRDALHAWSRQWEYPYAYAHARALRDRFRGGALPRAVDLGSGVTFFSFSVARLGYHVTCVDRDPIVGTDVPRAAAVTDVSPGRVEARVADAGKLPFENGEIDLVCCISVLEHAEDYGAIVDEIARILAPRGVLVATFDLDLRGDSEIGPARYRVLKEALAARFSPLLPETTTHPADLLRTDNARYGFPALSRTRKTARALASAARTILGRTRKAYPPYLLAVECGVYEKKSR